jgi:hypothetical protein
MVAWPRRVERVGYTAANAMAEPRSAAPDWLTVAAIAVVAGAITMTLHEALGHGGACVLAGGRNLDISSVSENCSVANRWIDAAGTLVNAATAGICALWLRRLRQATSGRFFCWLLMAFSGMAAAGYWLFSGVGGIGDWAAVTAGWQPAWAWRAGLGVLGAAVYVWFVRWAAMALRPHLPGGRERATAARRLMLPAYFAFGTLAVAAGLFNPVGPILIAESAAAGSFGGASGLCWGWKFAHGAAFADAQRAPAPLGRPWGWLAAAIVAAGLFIFVLGPGLPR